MKRLLYTLTGFAWGIFLFNKEIIKFAILLSLVTIIIDLLSFDE